VDAATVVGVGIGVLLIAMSGKKSPPTPVITPPPGYPMGDFKLSEHFTFWELTRTSRSDLLEHNRQEAIAYQNALRDLATNLLEPIRAHFNAPLTVSSAFRGPTVNKVVGGAATSQHMVGQAADIHVQGTPDSKVFEWVWKASGLKFGQLILETVGGAQWVHVSTGTKREVLTYINGKYAKLA
jgi:zinc D-Ala-D-Ala carboxypeptidase